MSKRRRSEKIQDAEPKVAPGIDEEDSYGEPATKSDLKKDEYTSVTRLIYDEYNPSE